MAAFRDTGFDWNCQRGPVEGCAGRVLNLARGGEKGESLAARLSMPRLLGRGLRALGENATLSSFRTTGPSWKYSVGKVQGSASDRNAWFSWGESYARGCNRWGNCVVFAGRLPCSWADELLSAWSCPSPTPAKPRKNETSPAASPADELLSVWSPPPPLRRLLVSHDKVTPRVAPTRCSFQGIHGLAPPPALPSPGQPGAPQPSGSPAQPSAARPNPARLSAARPSAAPTEPKSKNLNVAKKRCRLGGPPLLFPCPT